MEKSEEEKCGIQGHHNPFGLVTWRSDRDAPQQCSILRPSSFSLSSVTCHRKGRLHRFTAATRTGFFQLSITLRVDLLHSSSQATNLGER